MQDLIIFFLIHTDMVTIMIWLKKKQQQQTNKKQEMC